jgi:hypothetical protein
MAILSQLLIFATISSENRPELGYLLLTRNGAELRAE